MMPDDSSDTDRSTEGILKKRKTRAEIEEELQNLEKAREQVETRIDESQGKRPNKKSHKPNTPADPSSVKVTKSGKILTGVVRTSPVREESPPGPRQIIVQSNKKKLTIIIRNPEDRQREMDENPGLADAWGGEDDNVDNFNNNPKKSRSRDHSRGRRDRSHERTVGRGKRDSRERDSRDLRGRKQSVSPERTKGNRGRDSSREKTKQKNRDQSQSTSRERVRDTKKNDTGSNKKKKSGPIVSTRVLPNVKDNSKRVSNKDGTKESTKKQAADGKSKQTTNTSPDKKKPTTKTDGSKVKAPLKKSTTAKPSTKETRREDSPTTSRSKSPPPKPLSKASKKTAETGVKTKSKAGAEKGTRRDVDEEANGNSKSTKPVSKGTKEAEIRKKKVTPKPNDDEKKDTMKKRPQKVIESDFSDQETAETREDQSDAGGSDSKGRISKSRTYSTLENGAKKHAENQIEAESTEDPSRVKGDETDHEEHKEEEEMPKLEDIRKEREQNEEGEVKRKPLKLQGTKESKSNKEREDDEQTEKPKEKRGDLTKTKEPVRNQKETKARGEEVSKKRKEVSSRKERDDDSDDGRKRERTEEELQKEERAFREARIAHERALQNFIRTTTSPCVYFCPGEPCEKSRARQAQSDRESSRRIRELEAKDKARTK